ncbi:MAG: Abi family protein [Verrucomicrobiota bacterium]|nr:Abi family protein [Verrucomicrobiota bacterium]
MPQHYAKFPKTLEEQVALLQSRGLWVADTQVACQKISEINYYRFCGYGLFFEEFDKGKRLDRFKRGTQFGDILSLCEWDTSLQQLLWKGLSWFEVALRSVLNYEMSVEHKDPFWYANEQLFLKADVVDEFKKYCKAEKDAFLQNHNRGKEVFLRSYWQKYDGDLLPCWILAEILSFGKWSRLLGRLKKSQAIDRVAKHFQMPSYYLPTLTHSLSTLRNRCAHHNQLWNRILSAPPELPSKLRSIGMASNRLGVVLCVLLEVMRADMEKRQAFIDELKILLKKCPQDFSQALGMSWEQVRRYTQAKF